MANTYTTSAKVRLYDQREASSSTLLYPETALPCVKMTTGGGIISSGSNLTLNASSAWDSGIGAIVSSRYCPLSAVVSGETLYADMYTEGGSATVTEIETSTGYGTLLHALETTTQVRGVDSATNDLIPTEHAVAGALAGKQETLSAGSGITLTPDGRGITTVAISAALVVDPIGSAAATKYPTESAVRAAVDAAAASATNSAVSIMNTSISAAGYATSNWVNGNFIHSGEQTSVGFATSDSAGIVYVPGGSGLLVGTSGKLTLETAASSTLGGVMVPAGGALTVDTSGKLTAIGATNSAAGVFKVSTSISSDYRSWSDLHATTERAVGNYIASQGYGLDYVGPFDVITAGDSIYARGDGRVFIRQSDGTAISAGFKVSAYNTYPVLDNYSALASSASSTRRPVILYMRVSSSNGTWSVPQSAYTTAVFDSSTYSFPIALIDTGGKIMQCQHGDLVIDTWIPGAGGGGSGAYVYDGPFAVTNSGANVAGGYVKWLDGHTWIDGSSGLTTLGSGTYYSNATASGYSGTNTACYLCGSSGLNEGVLISASTATITYGGAIYSRSVDSDHIYSSGNTSEWRYSWKNGTTYRWTTAYIPSAGVAVYASASAATSVGTATAANTTIKLSGDTKVYSKTLQNGSAVTAKGYQWTNGTANVYTYEEWPTANNAYTVATLGSVFSFTTVEPDLPPAGKFYTMLAQNQGGTVKQQQHGTVWHEHWGDDYKGQFAISRVMRPSVKVNNKTITDTDTPNSFTTLAPFRYIIANGGMIYGDVNFRKEGLGLDIRSDGLYLDAPLFEYPLYSSGTYSATNGLYTNFGQSINVWLHIAPPGAKWPADYESNGQRVSGSTIRGWHFLVNTRCMEEVLDNQGFYAINLGWVTGNGSPQQDHKGAIVVRGRWA